MTSQTQETQFNTLNKYAKNLNELGRQGKLDPVIGRDEEIRRTLHILSRRSKNNPILVGEPGVRPNHYYQVVTQELLMSLNSGIKSCKSLHPDLFWIFTAHLGGGRLKN